LIIYKAKVVKVDPVYGELGNPIEAWVTFEINNKEIETFHVGSPIAPDIGKTYTTDFKIMTYDLEEVDIPKKLIHQITTDPEYLFVGEISEIDHEKRRIIFDCGLKLEADWDIAHEETAKKLKKGDWIFIKGKMFGDILDE
jgi:hypothetical protein